MQRDMGERGGIQSKASIEIMTISHVATLSHLAESNAEARSQRLTGRCRDLKGMTNNTENPTGLASKVKICIETVSHNES